MVRLDTSSMLDGSVNVAAGRAVRAELLAVVGCQPREAAARLRRLGLPTSVILSASREYSGDTQGFWSHLDGLRRANDEDAERRRLAAILKAAGPVGLAKLGEAELRHLVRHGSLQKLLVSWRGESVIMLGPTGVGKTAAAVALLRRGKGVCPGLRPVWQSGESLLLSQRRHPLGQGDPPEYEKARDAGLLVVDDPDWIRSGEADELFALVCASRYRTARPIIVTSGATHEQFVGRYGAAVFRRILESSRDADGRPTGVVIDCHGGKHAQRQQQ